MNKEDNSADSALDALLVGRLPDPDPTHHHFVLRDLQNNECPPRSTGSSSSDSESEGGRSWSPSAGSGQVRSSAARPSSTSQVEGLNALLELPSLPQTGRRTYRSREALVDYSKSILLTSEEYVHTMEVKAKRKQEALVEAARRREEASWRRSARDMEKQRKEQEKAQKVGEACARENFRQQWTTEAIREAGERMQYLMKNPPPLPPLGSRVAPFCGYLRPICKENMAKRLAKRRCIKFGGDSTNIEPAIPPPWMHLCDPRYADPQPSNTAEATDGRYIHPAAS